MILQMYLVSTFIHVEARSRIVFEMCLLTEFRDLWIITLWPTIMGT